MGKGSGRVGTLTRHGELHRIQARHTGASLQFWLRDLRVSCPSATRKMGREARLSPGTQELGMDSWGMAGDTVALKHLYLLTASRVILP